jgi:hypothetical protein
VSRCHAYDPIIVSNKSDPERPVDTSPRRADGVRASSVKATHPQKTE